MQKFEWLQIIALSLCMLGNFLCLSVIFFKIIFFENFYQELYQGVKPFGSRSGSTFWVQIVCKGYKQTTKVNVYRFEKHILMPTESKIGHILFLVPVHACNKPLCRSQPKTFATKGNKLKHGPILEFPSNFSLFLKESSKTENIFLRMLSCLQTHTSGA